MGFSRKRAFSTDKSDCVRNILTASSTNIKAGCWRRRLNDLRPNPSCTTQSKELNDPIQGVVRPNPRSCTTQSKELYDPIQGVVRPNPRRCTTQSKVLYDPIQGVVRPNPRRCTTESKELYDRIQGVVRYNPGSCSIQITCRTTQSKELYDLIQGVVRPNPRSCTHNPRSCTTQSKELCDPIKGVVRPNPRSCTTQSKELYDPNQSKGVVRPNHTLLILLRAHAKTVDSAARLVISIAFFGVPKRIKLAALPPTLHRIWCCESTFHLYAKLQKYVLC